MYEFDENELKASADGSLATLTRDAHLPPTGQADATVASMSQSFSSRADDWDHLLGCQVRLFAQQEFNALRRAPAWETARNVLDLGCGNGDYAALLGQTFQDKRIFGYDTSDELIASAKARYPEFATQFASGAVDDVAKVFSPDTVLMRFVLQHLQAPTQYFSDLADNFASLRQIIILEINLAESRHAPLMPSVIELIRGHETSGTMDGNVARSTLGQRDVIAGLVGHAWCVKSHGMVHNTFREATWNKDLIAILLRGWADALALSVTPAPMDQVRQEISDWTATPGAELNVAMDLWVIERLD